MAKIIQCMQCGSTKYINKSEGIYVCEACGTTTDYGAHDNETLVKIELALMKRQTAKFDEAKVLYEEVKRIIDPDTPHPELYFGLFACDYKVLFEVDNLNGNRVPIFYSSSETSVHDNPHLKKALSQAKMMGENNYQHYLELASKVEDARIYYQKIAKSVDPFDIFICFKKTDLDGKSFTRDYSVAMTLYQNLKSKYPDFNVFFSEKTLSEKFPATEYEPNIYYALHTSKILIVVSSKRDYLETQWVKNEWTRFVAINKASSIIPIYLEGSNVNIFPTEILKNNAYEESDYERIFNAIDVIMNSDENVRKKELEEKRKQEELFNVFEKKIAQNYTGSGTNQSNMFKRLINDLSDGMYSQASKTCDAILNLDADQPLAWFYSFLINKEIKSFDGLKSIYETDWVEDRCIKKALEFSKLNGYDEDRKKIENEIYQWILHIVQEALVLKESKKYDESKAKLIKVATHIEEYGREQRFLYFYHTFLLEMNCVNTNDLVSKSGIEKNLSFIKAMKYANQSQLLQVKNLLSVAQKNAEKYEEQVNNNNVILNESLSKLQKTVELKNTELSNIKEELKKEEAILEKRIIEIKDETKIEHQVKIDAKKEYDDKLKKLIHYEDSFSHRLLRFFYNLRSILLATVCYSYLITLLPNIIIMSYNYIFLGLGLAIIVNFFNMFIHYKRNNDTSVDDFSLKGFIIFGIFSGTILLVLPSLIGYSRAIHFYFLDKKQDRVQSVITKYEKEIDNIDLNAKKRIETVKCSKDELVGRQKLIDSAVNGIKIKKEELVKEHKIYNFEDSVTLKAKLDKEINKFKESMASLDVEIYKIAQIKV